MRFHAPNDGDMNVLKGENIQKQKHSGGFCAKIRKQLIKQKRRIIFVSIFLGFLAIFLRELDVFAKIGASLMGFIVVLLSYIGITPPLWLSMYDMKPVFTAQSILYCDYDNDSFVGSICNGTLESCALGNGTIACSLKSGGCFCQSEKPKILDCNDNPFDGGAQVSPGLSESCNGIDDNCNGSVDEEGKGSLCGDNEICYQGMCEMRYSCVEGLCEADKNGTFTTSNCDNQCRAGGSGSNEGGTSLGTGVMYSCNRGGVCEPDKFGTMTLGECTKMCSVPIDPGIKERYACSKRTGECVPSATGPYTTSDCNNECSAVDPEPKKYFCSKDGACIESYTGTMTLLECGKMCVANFPEPQTTYACASDGSCVETPGGPYTTSDCNNECSVQVTKYICTSTYDCVASDAGTMTLGECQNMCKEPQVPTTYACASDGSCVETPGGPYTTSDCNNECSVPTPPSNPSPPSPPSQDGVCGDSVFTCAVGSVLMPIDTACNIEDTWQCTGINGGSRAFCTFEDPCPVQYVRYAGEWGLCSEVCGGGIQIRDVVCRDLVSGDVVDDAFCGDQIKPQSEKSCNEQPCSVYNRNVGEWGECNALCGGGKRSRDVFCTNDSNQIVDDQFCDQSTKPPTESLCNDIACNNYYRSTTDWSSCSEVCGGGMKMRDVFCATGSGSIVDDSFCDMSTKPLDIMSCNDFPCQTYHWYVGEWQECSEICGGGIQTRTVYCTEVNSGNLVSDVLCDTPKPIEKQSCNTFSCEENSNNTSGGFPEGDTGDNGGTNYCGDGIVRNGEECDDGNAINGDGCSSSCTLEQNQEHNSANNISANIVDAIRSSLSIFERACVYNDVSYQDIIFKDVSWGSEYESINILRTYCIVKGYGPVTRNQKYYKDSATSKAEAIKIVTKVFALPEGYEFQEGKRYYGVMPYKDMKRNDRYTTYVLYAYQKGFLEGLGKRTVGGFNLKALTPISKDELRLLLLNTGVDVNHPLMDKHSRYVYRKEIADIVVDLFSEKFKDWKYLYGNNKEIYSFLLRAIDNLDTEEQVVYINNLITKLRALNPQEVGEKYNIHVQGIIEFLEKILNMQ